MQSKLRYLTSSKISCRSCTPSRDGGAWNGSLSQVIRSRYTNNCCRNNATRLDKLRAKVLLSCRYFTSNMAISAVQIWVSTAFFPGSDKGFHFQRLLQRLEKQLYLPALLINRRNRAGGQLQVIGDEDHDFLLFFHPHLQAPQKTILALSRQLDQSDHLILEHVALVRYQPLFHHRVISLVLQSGHKEHLLLLQGQPPIVICISAIKYQHRSGRKRHLLGCADVGLFAVADHSVLGQVAVVIQHQMQFHGSLGALVLRPIEHGQAQSNDRRVNRQQLVFEAELALMACRFAAAVL